MQHLQPNTTLQGGKYRIEQVLGKGGFASTYISNQKPCDAHWLSSVIKQLGNDYG